MFCKGESAMWRKLRDQHPGITLTETKTGYMLEYLGAKLEGEYLGDLLRLALYGTVEDALRANAIKSRRVSVILDK